MSIMIPAWVDGALVPVEKLDAHKRGLRHKAVSVFAVRGGEILLQRRALGKYHTPGLWANTCCTHPEFDEAPRACAIRRLHEELGITGVDPEFRHRLEYRAAVGGGLVEHELVDVFLVRIDGALEIAPNPDEVMETRWADLSGLGGEVRRNPHHYTPWLRIYLADHADVIFGPGRV